MKKLIMRTVGLYLNALAWLAPKKAARLGLSLFCYPFRAPLNTKQKAFLDTAIQSSFEHNEVKIQTYRWGSGPRNILLVHGWQSHTYRWKRYIEFLPKDEYTIYAFDAPGHGMSGGKFLSVPLYSEVIENFIIRLGSIESIVSHSIGSFSAIYTLYRNPSLASNNLVTLASPGEAQEFFDFYARTLALSPRTVNLITTRFEELFKKSPRYFSAPHFASSLTVPGLIIHDEEDDDTSVVHSRRIHEAWKTSRFIMTKGFGHNLRSDLVIQEVINFLRKPSVA
jgi:pimeloyl-ACP methyl ester carboxylesterase